MPLQNANKLSGRPARSTSKTFQKLTAGCQVARKPVKINVTKKNEKGDKDDRTSTTSTTIIMTKS